MLPRHSMQPLVSQQHIMECAASCGTMTNWTCRRAHCTWFAPSVLPIETQKGHRAQQGDGTWFGDLWIVGCSDCAAASPPAPPEPSDICCSMACKGQNHVCWTVRGHTVMNGGA